MRRLVAALACRAQGARMYAKPLQNLDVRQGTTVLEHIVSLLRTVAVIDEIVLGISEGVANAPFVEFAATAGLRHIIGDQKDVLGRLIQCGDATNGTDIFRITTESPFCYVEPVEQAWRQHVEAGNDVTATDSLPDGTHFEIYTLGALRRSHADGEARHRSEYCNLYIREHREMFKVDVLPVPPALQRQDLRLTVDYPEDLVVCRRIYEALKSEAPRLKLSSIVSFLDEHPELPALVAPYVTSRRIW